MTDDLTKVRIDKWLWAARFFKTRNLAKQAVEGGKVHCEGQRLKPSKEVTPGMRLKVRQGYDDKEVRILALSEQRRGAPEAALLYEETPESLARREERAAQRRAGGAGGRLVMDHKPNKKERRQIHRLKKQMGMDPGE